MATVTEAKEYELLHPVVGTPTTATQIGYWRDAGRIRGIKLQFPDGHVASLTYGDISNLEDALDEYEAGE